MFLLSLLSRGFLLRKDDVFCQMLFLHLLTGLYGSYPLFCYLIAEAGTSKTMLTNSGEIGHHCPIPDLREEALFFPIEDDISCGLFINGFDDV